MIIRKEADIIISGRAGGDAEVKRSKKGNVFTAFSVCANDIWFSVAMSGVVDVAKGDHVLVTGKYEAKTHNGKKYHNISADYVNAVDTSQAHDQSDGATDITPDEELF